MNYLDYINLQNEQFSMSLILGVFISMIIPEMNYDIAQILQNPLIKTTLCVGVVLLISRKTLPINIMFLLGIIMLFSVAEQKNLERILTR